MKNLLRNSLILFMIFARIAAAEVMNAGAGGFIIANEVIVDATREAVWQAAIEDIGKWWSSDGPGQDVRSVRRACRFSAKNLSG